MVVLAILVSRRRAQQKNFLWQQCSTDRKAMFAKRWAQVLAFGRRRSAQQSLQLSFPQPCGDSIGMRRAGQGWTSIMNECWEASPGSRRAARVVMVDMLVLCNGSFGVLMACDTNTFHMTRQRRCWMKGWQGFCPTRWVHFVLGRPIVAFDCIHCACVCSHVGTTLNT